MLVTITDPVSQTYVFSVILLVALFATLRKRTNVGTFGIEVTQELKGFAILAIVFAHIGYFLVTDNRFLFPLSVLAGVGVDLFLLLSGFGLTASALKRKESPMQFYHRRLKKLYVPLWVVLVVLFTCDYLFLHKMYGLRYLASSFLGFFPHADIYNDVNSPLWYFSLIVFYYLLFPLVFSRKRPVVSAIVLFSCTWVVTWFSPSVLQNVISLYKLHSISFPLGMIAASYISDNQVLINIEKKYLYYPAVAALMGSIAYFAINSGVGKWYVETELISIVTVLLVITLFILKRHDIRFLYLFGVFSFEVYLMHWPLLYRYDILFNMLPGYVAMSVYLGLFLGLAWLLQRGTRRF